MLSIPTLKRIVVALGPDTRVVDVVNWILAEEIDPAELSIVAMQKSFMKFSEEFKG
jgi:hypothetical protein